MSHLLRLLDAEGHIKPLEQIEYAVLKAALERYKATEAAQRLGIGRSTLYRKLDQYGLKRPKNS